MEIKRPAQPSDVWIKSACSEAGEVPGASEIYSKMGFKLGLDAALPFYLGDSGRSSFFRLSPKPGVKWYQLADIEVKDPVSSNLQALVELQRVNGVRFCFSQSPDPLILGLLLNGIQGRFCFLAFQAPSFTDEFQEALIEYFEKEKADPRDFNGVLFWTDCGKIPALHERTSAYVNFRWNGLAVPDLTRQKTETILPYNAFLVSLGRDFLDSIVTLRSARFALELLWKNAGKPGPIPLLLADCAVDADPGTDPGSILIGSTLSVLAGVLGAADGICTPQAKFADARDRYGVANISGLLAQESLLDKIEDPLAGTWFIDELTHQRTRKIINAWGLQEAFVEDVPDPFEKKSMGWMTREGIVIPAESLEVRSAGPVGAEPGVFPFLRGPYASMYTRKPWTIRQYAGFSTAVESNAFYRNNLAAGQTGLSVAFDLPTHRGYDSDHVRVKGDVGKTGVAIDSVEDMKILFSGIPLERMSVSMTMNGAVLPVMAFYIVAAEEQGVSADRLTGTIQNDILKEFMVRNTFIYPPPASMRIVADVMSYCSKHLPRFNSISVSGYHMHEAGAPAHIELAYTLADGIEYLKSAIHAGIDVDKIAPRISFFWGIGMNFFMEVAKMRAARRLWAEMVAEFGPRDPRSSVLRTHCQTSGWSLTAQDPANNVVRTTVEALAAICGGTQSLHTNALDEALALPSDHAAAVARNTQRYIRDVSGITRAIDPLGGGWYLEYLTEQLVERVRAMLTEIREAGGMTAFIREGVPKMRIAEAAARRQARIDAGLDVIIGVNSQFSGDKGVLDLRVVDIAKVRQGQTERLLQVRAARDNEKVRAALEALTIGARTNANLLDLSVQAARVRCTLGEISQALENVFGRFSIQSVAVQGVYSSAMADQGKLSRLRQRCADFGRANGRRPRILVAKIGQDGHDRGAQVIAAGFADIGFDVDIGPLFATPAEVVRQALENDVHVIGISTLAGAHPILLPELMHELRAAGMTGDPENSHEVLVVAGGVIPEQDHAAMMDAGIALIFGPGTVVHEAAEKVLDRLEASGPAEKS